jgi:hypothetical protein
MSFLDVILVLVWLLSRNNIACLLKAIIVKPTETGDAREWFCKNATIREPSLSNVRMQTQEELLGEVFILRSVPRLYIQRGQTQKMYEAFTWQR